MCFSNTFAFTKDLETALRDVKKETHMHMDVCKHIYMLTSGWFADMNRVHDMQNMTNEMDKYGGWLRDLVHVNHCGLRCLNNQRV